MQALWETTTEWETGLFTCFHPLLGGVAPEMSTPPNLWALEKDLGQKGDADVDVAHCHSVQELSLPQQMRLEEDKEVIAGATR